jgi:DNA-binding NarL/FixJ family response regulator
MNSIRVLIIEDNPGDARLIGEILSSVQNARLELHFVGDLKSGLQALREKSIDVVLLDLNLPDAWELEGLRRLSDVHPNIPIIALTDADVPQIILDAIKIGARDYFVKDRIESDALIAAILEQAARTRQQAAIAKRAAASVKEQERHVQVLVVEDNPGDYALVRHMLARTPGIRFDLIHAPRLSDAVQRLRLHFDVILLDLGLPDSQDLDTLRRVRAREPLTPILVLTALENRQQAVDALANGAQDYLVKGQIDKQLLVRAILRHVKFPDQRAG